MFGLDGDIDGPLDLPAVLLVDHSDAQRKAIYRAMGLVLLEMKGETVNATGMDPEKFKKQLTEKADEMGRVALEKSLKGCLFHFEQSVHRIMSNARFVPIDKRSAFRDHINTIKSTPAQAEFIQVMKKMERLAPGTSDWVKWWSNPLHAKLMFPSYAPMGHEKFSAAETTNNRVEANNRDMGRCVRSKLPIAEAIESEYNVSDPMIQ